MSKARLSSDTVETLYARPGVVSISQDALEVVSPYSAPSPTTPTGAGVSQKIIEVVYILATVTIEAKVAQCVVEILYNDGEPLPTATGAATTFGYAT